MAFLEIPNVPKRTVFAEQVTYIKTTRFCSYNRNETWVHSYSYSYSYKIAGVPLNLLSQVAGKGIFSTNKSYSLFIACYPVYTSTHALQSQASYVHAWNEAEITKRSFYGNYIFQVHNGAVISYTLLYCFTKPHLHAWTSWTCFVIVCYSGELPCWL